MGANVRINALNRLALAMVMTSLRDVEWPVFPLIRPAKTTGIRA